MHSSRSTYFLLLIVTVIAGLASRHTAFHFPDFVGLYIGDALWAMMVYWITGCFFPALPFKQKISISLAFCFSIEISQFYHAPWIDQLRATRIGGLVLGFVFSWSDLVAYTAGILLASLLDFGLAKRTMRM